MTRTEDTLIASALLGAAVGTGSFLLRKSGLPAKLAWLTVASFTFLLATERDKK